MVEILLAIVIGGMAQAVAEPERKPIAFVGEQLTIQEIPCPSRVDPETGATHMSICMDALFEATYRVLEVYEGALEVGSTVTFQAADHYGFPEFARYQTALVFIRESEGALYHIKYQWANAYQLDGGGFGSCGCDYEIDCRDLAFVPPITTDLSQASQYVFDEYRNDPAWEVVGNQAVCVMGHRTEDIYNMERPELLEMLRSWR